MATKDDGREESALSLFSAFDLDGNGAVGLQELLQVVQSSRRVADKKHAKRIRMLEAEVRQASETCKVTGQSHITLKSGGLVTFAAGAGEPSLGPHAFASFIVALTKDDTADEFSSFVDTARDAVADALERTQGSEFRRAVWSAFQMLDANQDGFVDIKELEPLLVAETKNDKKAIAKWKHHLGQRQLESRYLAPLKAAGVAAAPETADGVIVPAEIIRKVAEPVSLASTVVASDAKVAEEVEGLRLTLGDFQNFMAAFIGDGEQAKLDAVLGRLRDALQADYDAFLKEKKVNAVLDAILDDLLRERPDDVLDGVIRSCERLKRQGTGTRTLRRVQSVVKVRDPVAERKASLASQSPDSAREGSPLQQ